MSARAELHRLRTHARGELAYRRWARGGEGSANGERVEQLRERYAGRRAFVMGNGPSLLQSDLNLLADEVTIVSNAHYLIWDQLTYVPTFIVVEDQLVAEDRASELRELSGITRIFPFDFHSLLGPAGDDRLYLNFPRHYRGVPKFSHDLTRRAYWGGTVSFLNLQIAAFLGCNPIYLIGFDHSYKTPPPEEMKNTVIHSESEDVNHIHPNYFGPGYRWHDPNVARMEQSYVCARDELEKVGVKVYNSTVGGHLEVFERVPYERAVAA